MKNVSSIMLRKSDHVRLRNAATISGVTVNELIRRFVRQWEKDNGGKLPTPEQPINGRWKEKSDAATNSPS